MITSDNQLIVVKFTYCGVVMRVALSNIALTLISFTTCFFNIIYPTVYHELLVDAGVSKQHYFGSWCFHE